MCITQAHICSHTHAHSHADARTAKPMENPETLGPGHLVLNLNGREGEASPNWPVGHDSNWGRPCSEFRRMLVKESGIHPISKETVQTKANGRK